MTYRSVCLKAAILLVAMMMLAGCAGTSKPSKFYLLLTLPDAEGPTPAAVDIDAPSVMVGPITLAAYLDRDQIVRRSGGNELSIDEFARWGEPLQDTFYRVLVDNLSLLLNTPRIYAFNRHDTIPADFQVVIDVIRFDSASNGDAVLSAFWTVSAQEDQTLLLTKKSVLRAPASNGGVAGLVDAQNRALTDFSREIAAAVQSLKP